MSIRRTIASTAVLAALAGGTVINATSASAAIGCPDEDSNGWVRWDASNTPADILGSYGFGATCNDYIDGSRKHVNATVQDSAGDGKSACLQIHASYADGGTRDDWLYIGGKGNYEYKQFSYAPSVRTIWVREGTGTGGVCTKMANGVEVIFD